MNRKDYMDGRVSHDEYYNHLADIIGRHGLERLVGHIASVDELREALQRDPHLNNIPLQKWDRMDNAVRDMVSHNAKAVMEVSWNATGQPLKPGTFCWSLAESGCVLKAVARRMVEGVPA